MKQFVLLLSLAILIVLPSMAETMKDVRKMGDVWVVTIDKSGSMKKRIVGGETKRISPEQVADEVYDRLKKGDAFATADFSKDHFLFFTSGFSYPPEVKLVGGHGKALADALPFDQSFIHTTDNTLHSFSSKGKLLLHIRTILAQNDYSHDQSFVSQIRLFSILKAVNYMKDNGKEADYDNLKVVTITDDADQNDQWRNDYREIKRASPSKLRAINDSTSKYIYNEFIKSGKGSLNEIYKEENGIPHIWVYEYRTLQQEDSLANIVSKDSLGTDFRLLSIDAANGANIKLRALADDYRGDEICFYSVDTIMVNDHKISIGSSFQNNFDGYYRYDNKFKVNDVTIKGHFQVKYNDEIYGTHYKTMYFIQNEKVLSKKLYDLSSVLVILVISLLLGYLIYILIIRPHQIMFTIYSGLGEKTTVKRGFRHHWANENTPLQCYQTDYEDFWGCITRRHRNVTVTPLDLPYRDGEELLLCSCRPITLSVDVKEMSAEDDIEQLFRTRSATYPPLLKEVYEKTFIARMYRRYALSRNTLVRRFYRALIRVNLFFCKKYYYPILLSQRTKRIYLCAEEMLEGKRFSIEYNHIVSHVQNQNTILIQKSLTQYYTENPKAIYDILVSCLISVDNVYWNVIQLNDNRFGTPSLRNVRSLVRFIQEGTDISELLLKQVENHFRKEYHGASVGSIVIVENDEYEKEEMLFDFDVIESTAPGYISFVETAEIPHTQILYSPVKDGDVREKFVKINSKYLSGHLYLSVIPVKGRTSGYPLMKLLSKTVVASDIKGSSLISFGRDELEFRNINEKY